MVRIISQNGRVIKDVKTEEKRVEKWIHSLFFRF